MRSRSLLLAGVFLCASAAPSVAQNTQAPAGATAKCSDGTYSTAKSHRGACSRHGGIAQWLADTSNASRTSAAPPNATARCEDGTYTTSSGRGACTRHGGVSAWLTSDSTQATDTGARAATRAAADTVPAGATALCKDGTYSHSTHRSGTCSRHHGVAQWLQRPGGK
jgi:hypothetical protein